MKQNLYDFPLLNQYVIQQLAEQPAKLDLTTNDGLESVVKAEWEEKCGERSLELPDILLKPYHFSGHVHVRSEQPLRYYLPVIEALRSTENVLLTIHDFPITGYHPLKTIGDVLSKTYIPALDHAETFRVTSQRSGNHDFSSMNVQRDAGSLIEEQYNLKVDLEGYDIEVRVDVFDNHCLLGIQLTRQSLSNRLNRDYIPRVSLKPHVAYGMIHYAGLKGNEDAILDPLCGSGTILLELNHIYPKLPLYGNDIYPGVIEGAKANIQRVGVNDRVIIQQGDVFHLDELYDPDSFDAIITNPPFGVKLAKEKNFPNFYNHLIDKGERVLKPTGTMVLLTMKSDLLQRIIAEREGMKLENLKSIKLGGIQPRLFQIRKVD